MVRTAVASGDVALAERLVNGVEPLFPLHEHALCAARAILAEVAGEHRNAAGLYADAAGRWQQFGFVPERATDFIFAVYAEQFGLAGCLLLLAVFTVLIVRLARSAAVASDRFGHLLCAGMAVILGTQVIQNVGMNIGATPIAGIPLPLISHGGSATIAFLAGLGLVQSVMLGRRAVLHQEPRPLDSYLLGESGTVRLPM